MVTGLQIAFAYSIRSIVIADAVVLIAPVRQWAGRLFL